MIKESLVKELRYKTNLLPKDVIEDNENIKNFVLDLQSILDEYRTELEQEELFQTNFINTINYIYIGTFNKKVESRNKNLFSDNFMSSVFSLPAHA